MKKNMNYIMAALLVITSLQAHAGTVLEDVFNVVTSISGYAGKVAGGEGYQFFIPYGVDPMAVLEEVDVLKLK